MEAEVEESEIQAAIRSAEEANYSQANRGTAYWEVYVDRGN